MFKYKVSVGLLSDPGRKRKNNEDSCLVYEPKNRLTCRSRGRLYAVADGIGGLAAGEIASRVAVERLKDYYYAIGQSNPPQQALQQAVLAAHESICRQALTTPEYAGMGSTLTAAAVIDNEVYIAHVGDSRAYLIRDSKIAQLTSDHTVIAGLLQKGEITPEQAKTHPQRHKLNRSLGGRRLPDVEMITCSLNNGDALVLCSDGLHDLVSDREIRNIVTSIRNPQRAAELLVKLANERGGRDNITVIVIKISSAVKLLQAAIIVLFLTLIICGGWFYFNRDLKKREYMKHYQNYVQKLILSDKI